MKKLILASLFILSAHAFASRVSIDQTTIRTADDTKAANKISCLNFKDPEEHEYYGNDIVSENSKCYVRAYDDITLTNLFMDEYTKLSGEKVFKLHTHRQLKIFTNAFYNTVQELPAQQACKAELVKPLEQIVMIVNRNYFTDLAPNELSELLRTYIRCY